MKIYNTLTREKEDFKPINDKKVSIYACGPTVYDFAHIGHGRKYVNDDVLKRFLEVIDEYKVTHVQNITDVGHLVSDSDEGAADDGGATQKDHDRGCGRDSRRARRHRAPAVR